MLFRSAWRGSAVSVRRPAATSGAVQTRAVVVLPPARPAPFVATGVGTTVRTAVGTEAHTPPPPWRRCKRPRARKDTWPRPLSAHGRNRRRLAHSHRQRGCAVSLHIRVSWSRPLRPPGKARCHCLSDMHVRDAPSFGMVVACEDQSAVHDTVPHASSLHGSINAPTPPRRRHLQRMLDLNFALARVLV